jgi:phenylacetate-CoA ligase
VHHPLETAPVETVRARQLARLNELLAEVLPRNRFYARKFAGRTLPASWRDFHELPFTTKQELVTDQSEHPPLGSIATYDADRYAVYHQTSGTTGRPLVVLDTEQSWQWWVECWQYVYAGAGVTATDRVFFAFSFGPFIGFWSAHAGARRLGALTIPGGGLDTKARLDMMRRTRPTVVLCTPTYALRLAEAARSEGFPLTGLGVRTLIHAGEPGASIPSVRARIEDAWGARCYDHAGGTEVGAFAYPCGEQTGMHLNEAEFITEILDSESGAPVKDGEIGELIVTNLGRAGWPVIRYRTGDLVRAGGRTCSCGRTFVMTPGGLLGRRDDLMIVRGINVYPAAIEAIVRTFDVDEFRILRTRRDAMEELLIEVETSEETAVDIAELMRQRIGIRIQTRVVPAGSLPRWELKARRVVDLREARSDTPV